MNTAYRDESATANLPTDSRELSTENGDLSPNFWTVRGNRPAQTSETAQLSTSPTTTTMSDRRTDLSVRARGRWSLVTVVKSAQARDSHSTQPGGPMTDTPTPQPQPQPDPQPDEDNGNGAEETQPDPDAG